MYLGGPSILSHWRIRNLRGWDDILASRRFPNSPRDTLRDITGLTVEGRERKGKYQIRECAKTVSKRGLTNAVGDIVRCAIGLLEGDKVGSLVVGSLVVSMETEAISMGV